MKNDGYFNTTQYLGELADGICLLALGEKSHLDIKESLNILSDGNKPNPNRPKATSSSQQPRQE